MHIPDGFLDVKTILGTSIISIGALGAAVKITNKNLQDKQIPFMGVMAAFIFAAQMVNFPVIGGTSGHLIGATLATVLFGPAIASIIIATVVFVQCIVFQDGGATALGANLLNMSVISVYVSYVIYQVFSKILKFKYGKNFAIVIASWCSVISASLAAAVEISFAGILPIKVLLPAIVGWHTFIGMGEAIITTAVLCYIYSLKINTVPELN